MINNYILLLTIGFEDTTSFILFNIDTQELKLLTRRELIAYGISSSIKLHNVAVYSDTNTFVLNSIVPRISPLIPIKDLTLQSKLENNTFKLSITYNKYDYEVYRQAELEKSLSEDIESIYNYDCEETEKQTEHENIISICPQSVSNIYYNLNSNKYTHLKQSITIISQSPTIEILVELNQSEEEQNFSELTKNSVNSIYLTHRS